MLASQFYRLNQVFILITLVYLAGCSSDNHTLNAGEKARMVAEQISNTQACAVFKDKLALTTMESAAIDAVYYDATKAGCIKKDI
jgi:uncharacterized lipoprotein YajG